MPPVLTQAIEITPSMGKVVTLSISNPQNIQHWASLKKM